MKSSRLLFFVVLLAGLLALLFYALRHEPPPAPPSVADGATSAPNLTASSPGATSAEEISPAPSSAARADLAALRTALQRLATARDTRPQEVLLTFSTVEAYRRFLARAQHRGLAVLAQLDALLAVRIRYDDLAALEAELRENGADYTRISANYLVHIPAPPPKAERAALEQLPFRDTALAYLGAAASDRSTWGRGVTIAVLDTGVAPDPTFGGDRVRYLNVGLGTLPGSGTEDGHGTSVAALAAGASADAPGVAPAASILSLRVTDADGISDLFTVAQAIVAAVDAGAPLVNLSLGGYATTAVLTLAIDYARTHGVVLIAAAGNDQASQLAWPAADPRVVSVGAVDALGRQVAFSNSGPELQIAAPGYGVQTAWIDNRRVYVSGTSASAPLVAGAIAAVMSQNRALSADQAWAIVRASTSEAGPPGADPDYGQGILNLTWALNATNPAHVDPAVSTHYFDASHHEMEFVIQNRGPQPVSGLALDVDTSGSLRTYPLPTLPAGGLYVVKVPVDDRTLAANAGLTYTTQLVTPFGLEDADVSNNRLVSRLPAAAVAP